MLDALSRNGGWKFASLRYFNPVDSFSGNIGENHLAFLGIYSLSLLNCQRTREIKIFGNDYETTDGTGIRDYLHVMDW